MFLLSLDLVPTYLPSILDDCIIGRSSSFHFYSCEDSRRTSPSLENFDSQFQWMALRKYDRKYSKFSQTKQNLRGSMLNRIRVHATMYGQAKVSQVLKKNHQISHSYEGLGRCCLDNDPSNSSQTALPWMSYADDSYRFKLLLTPQMAVAVSDGGGFSDGGGGGGFEPLTATIRGLDRRILVFLFAPQRRTIVEKVPISLH